MPSVESVQTQLARDLAYLRDYFWEQKWRDGFYGLVSEVARRTRVVLPADLERFEGACEQGLINDEEALAVRNLDMIIRGVRGTGAAVEDVYLAVEISMTIDEYDVTRAIERAAILGKAGYNAIPVVAGAVMDARLRDSAVERGVEVVFGD